MLHCWSAAVVSPLHSKSVLKTCLTVPWEDLVSCARALSVDGSVVGVSEGEGLEMVLL